MVGQHLGAVLGALRRQRLDPAGRPPVLARAPRARDLLVGDVPHQRVGEGVLRLAQHDRVALPPQQLLSLQLVQHVLRRPALPLPDLGQRAEPERAADHRRVLQQQLLIRGQRVEAGGDDRLHRLRQRQVGAGQLRPRALAAQQPAVEQHPHVLLGEQRVAAGPRQQRRAQLRRQLCSVQQVGDHVGRLLIRQRLQLEHGAARRTGPLRPPVEQLRPAGGHHQQGAGEAVAEVVGDELEQPVVGPVDVLEHQHQRAARGDLLQEAAPGGKRLGAAVAA